LWEKSKCTAFFNTVFPKTVPFMGCEKEKHGTAKQAPEDNMEHAFCILDN
jgi:hypothetical protein